MVSQPINVVRELLFQLSSQVDFDNEEFRRLLCVLVHEIEETESIDLHYSLSLNVRNLGDKQLLVLVKALEDGDLSRLQVLNLSGCFFQSQNAVTKLAEVLESRSMPALRCLDLSGHYSLREEGSAALARALSLGKYSSLQHLGLPRCDIDAVIEAIAEGGVRQLQNLVFSGKIESKKSGQPCIALPGLLQAGHLSQLRKLVLMNLSVDPAGMATMADSFRSRQANPLEHLDLSSNILGDQGCKALADLFQCGDLALLQRLRLYSCSISSKQLETISEALESSQKSSSLRYVDLSWNSFGDEGAFALACVIQRGHLCSLRRLNLGYCGIGARGIIAILEALGMARMLQLEWLNLLGNRIGKTGASSVANTIAGMLEMLPRLETVNLIDSKQGNAALFEALKVAVKRQHPESSFTAEHCGLKRRARLPFCHSEINP